MIKGDYLAAIEYFEAILKVDPKYPDAADLLGVARGGAKNAAQLAVDTGNKAEMGGDYDAAVKQYERAQQLDPDSTAPADAMRRLKARMQGEGEDAFKRARQFDALGRSADAVTMYEKAVKLLPADHANTKIAKERLAALRGGE
jgi:tetratricopeptide (TPR) repeat protein